MNWIAGYKQHYKALIFLGYGAQNETYIED